MADRAIGVFDSGIGGLTVLKALVELMPAEDFIYLGDTARLPYGTKSPEVIVRYSRENTEFLLAKGIKLLVVACNTASAVALDEIARQTSVPVVGVIEPGARAAAKLSRSGKIGVIGTEATIASGAYTRDYPGARARAPKSTPARVRCWCRWSRKDTWTTRSPRRSSRTTWAASRAAGSTRCCSDARITRF